MIRKHNQVRNSKIRQYAKSDDGKLAALERALHSEFPKLEILKEPYLLFRNNGEDTFVDCMTGVPRGMESMFKIQHPDMVIFKSPRDFVILELDGSIHDTKTEKTEKRNQVYETNKFEYVVVNEANLKDSLKISQNAELSDDQIAAAFLKPLKQLLK